MRHLPTLELVRHELRTHVCIGCTRRAAFTPRGSGAATCEATCPVFVHLPALVEFAERLDPVVADRRAALRRRLVGLCAARAAARAGRLRRGAAAGAAVPPETADAAAATIAAAVGT